MTKIGENLLPNIYISEIQVHEHEFISKVYVVDKLESPTWSKKQIYQQHYKVMMVYTKSTLLINSLSGGSVAMDPKQIYQMDPFAIIEKVPISQASEMRKDNSKYFCLTFKNKIPVQPSESLFLFTCVVVDPKPIMGPSHEFKTLIQGPISSEKIISKNKINNETFIYLDQNDKQFVGPVHYHESQGWMGGATHTDEPHPTLKQVTIENIKIKNYRQKSLPIKKQKKKDNFYIFSDLFSSFDREGKYNFLFFINLKELIINKTKFGPNLTNISEKLLNSILKQLSFNVFSIQRHRIKSYNRTTSSGSKVKSTYRTFESKRVFTSYQDSRDSFVRTFGKGKLTVNDFLSDSNLKSFEFSDFEMKKGLAGEYKYSLNLIFDDPTTKLVESLYDEMTSALEILQNFTNRVNRFFKKNKNMLSLDNSFIQNEDALANGDQESHPWIICSEVYAKYSSFLFDLSTEDIENTKKASLGLINPKTLTINSLKTFEKDFNNIIKHFKSKIGINFSKIKNFSLRSYPKNNNTVNLISVNNDYSEIIKPTKSRKFYNFLQPNLSPGVKILRPADFKNRMNMENSKFFAKKPNFKNLTILNNLNESKSSFFSPYSLSNNSNEINVSKIEEIDKKQINLFFKNEIKKPRNFTLSIAKKLKDEEEQKYILSTEFLGKESNFNSVEAEKFCSFIEEESPVSDSLKRKILLKSKTKLLSKFSIDSPNSIFKEKFKSRLQNKNKDIIIPNQLRAIAAADSDATVESMTKNQLVDPENDLINSVNYLNLMQVEVLAGFDRTKNGDLAMRNPKWELVTSFEHQVANKNNLYRMVPAKTRATNFDLDKSLSLEYSDKYFSINQNQKNNASLSVDGEVDSSLIFNEFSNYNLDAANSNAITKQKVTLIEEVLPFIKMTAQPEVRAQPQPSDAPTTSRTTNVRMPSRSYSGGGYSGGGY